MKEPAVAALIFKATPGPYIRFDSPPTLTIANAAFRGSLDGGELRIELSTPLATEEMARKLVEPYLRAWEIRSGLNARRPEIQFEFVRSEYIDLDPGRSGPHKMIGVSRSLAVSTDAVLVRVMPKYPDPKVVLRSIQISR